MNRSVTSTASDATLADALRVNPGLTGMAQRVAFGAREQAGRHTPFLDLREFVNATWDLVTWNANPRMSDAEHLRHWLFAAEVMTALADLPDNHATALSVHPDLHMPSGIPALYELNRKQVALNRAAALASNPSLAALADLGARREAAVQGARAIQAAQEAQALPGHLLAELRARGVFLVVQDGMLGVPIGPAATRLTAADKAAIVQNKSALIGLLMAEAARPTVTVLA